MQFLNLGVGGAIAVFVIIVWRQDRRTWTSQYERLAGDFRVIVQDNTAAMVKLTDHLEKVVVCPFAQAKIESVRMLPQDKG